ncbi:MAG TPA: carbamate kinase [Syntrophomonadaceae bacterium]|nr:carbamate kinase [Syntrophomonadaceae bacterium]
MNKLMVIALGGNSLIKDKDKISAEDQREVVHSSCKHIVNLVKKGFDVVITHGNGPQVGFNLLRSEAAKEQLPPQPLDVCVAETQGSIGYMIQQSLINEYRSQGIDKDVVTVVTQVRVNAGDEAYSKPSKPVGPFYDQAEAQHLMLEKGWDMVEDSGRGYRRVVASPQPVEIVECRAIRALVAQGFTVIACGGGGIPVTGGRVAACAVTADGGIPAPGKKGKALVGSAAVIDKDRAASLLAGFLGADILVIPTAVSKVCLNFRKPDQIELDSISLKEARCYLEQGHFAVGSMGPKIEAGVSFLEAGGKEVIITLPELIEEAVQGNAGTHIYSE